ncbi:glutathione S-transferase family protein [Lentibacter algarum]|uniref:glutathione S-transferase family protein n=1 Tax=Lentibacter algarum TaxID=576131 RepID=UPI001C088B47|nr:glutathione S-transferase family protein [Lentibacter algarum]MBU2983070.1 glutathione S-transferase family protein [Lentibacter algarum]
MITLLTYPKAFGEFSASPFCTKAGYLLQMSGFEWQREDTLDPRKFKYAKLPAIRVDGEVICDSDNIRAFLESKGADFDAALNGDDRASARAFSRMAEEHMYFHQALDRWGNEDVWPIIQQEYFSMIPKLVRGFVTGKMRKVFLQGMHVQGLGRFTPEERLARLEHDLQAIAGRLENRKFLFGDTPCSADASIAAILGGMRASPAPTPQSKRIIGDAVLMRYVDAMQQTVKLP